MSKLWVRIPQTPDSQKSLFFFLLFLFKQITIVVWYLSHTKENYVDKGSGQTLMASSWEFDTFRICGQWRVRWACTFVQYHHSLCRSHWKRSDVDEGSGPTFVPSKAVVLLLFVHFLMFLPVDCGAPCWSLFCYALMSVLSCFAIILSRKSEHDAFTVTVFLR